MNHEDFLREAIRLAEDGLDQRAGGPFGAVVVHQGQVIGRGRNEVTSQNDPTAHAEVNAIRDACRSRGDFRLIGCTLYTSCEPCPMCLAAIYWARLDEVVYAASRSDAASIGFDDERLYEQLPLPVAERDLPMRQLLRDEALIPFQRWSDTDDKVEY